MRKPGIYLSPSRQPKNIYAVENTNEEKEMVAVSEIIRDILAKEYSYPVHQATLSLNIGKEGRPREAERKGCSIYLAIHSNAGGKGKARGAVALYHPKSEESKMLGTYLAEELNRICPYKSNRAQTLVNGMEAFNGKGYGEIRAPYELGMIPVLMETNFHDHPDIARWIIGHKQEIARAYVKGIARFLSLKPVEERAEEKKVVENHKALQEEGDKLYRVQVGAFRKKENAEILLARLYNEGFDGFIHFS